MSNEQTTEPMTELWNLLGQWFYKPDFQALRIVLGAMQAHYLNVGDPAWLFVVAPPGTGKTTTSIMGAAGLPAVHMLGDITESTLLSGFHGHQQPGLLEKLGPVTQQAQVYTTNGNGILLMKDFTTVLSMRREKRAAILGQLREIHDGQFRRDFGTGVTKIWKGRVTVIAAVTPVLDRHYGVFSTLGERFLQVRWHRPDSPEAGEWAMRQQGREGEIQRQARLNIVELFRDANKKAPELTPQMQRRIAALAEILAIGRTHIFRSGFGNREIEYVPEPEANTRISKGLAAIALGIASLGRQEAVDEHDFQDLVRVGFDCLPQNRWRLLNAAIRGRNPESVSMPQTVRKRQLEELAELELISIDAFDNWSTTSRLQGLLRAAGLEQRVDASVVHPVLQAEKVLAGEENV